MSILGAINLNELVDPDILWSAYDVALVRAWIHFRDGSPLGAFVPLAKDQPAYGTECVNIVGSLGLSHYTPSRTFGGVPRRGRPIKLYLTRVGPLKVLFRPEPLNHRGTAHPILNPRRLHTFKYYRDSATNNRTCKLFLQQCVHGIKISL